MAQTDDEKKAMTEMLAEAFKQGLKAYRSEVEEEEAKNNQNNNDADKDKDKKGGNGDSNGRGFSLARYLLGG